MSGVWLARQLKGRRTAKAKVPAWYADPRIAYPPSANLAQASSEATARYKADELQDRTVADLCGGTGVDAWFMARTAKALLFNEPDEALLTLARHNLPLAGGAEAVFESRPAESFSAENLGAYDTLYLDPSRRAAGGGRAWTWAQMQPDLTRMPWLWSGRWQVLLKLSPGQDFTEVERQLPPVRRWDVLSVGNEVRELLAWLPGDRPGPAPRRVVELDWQGRSFRFDFDPAEAAPRYPLQAAEAGQVLLEPGAALLKAAAQDAYAAQAGIAAKLHANTHLYLTAEPVPGWFGRAYRIRERLPVETRTLQAVGPCQISARNFGLEPEAIRKKHKLSAGGAAHLFFVQDVEGYAALRIERV